MPPEIHPLDAVKRRAYNLSLKTDEDKWYFENYWNDEATTRRKKIFDENVKRNENAYFNRIIKKIEDLRHDTIVKPRVLNVDSRTPYEIALDKAARKILANDPTHQAWIADQPRRRKLSEDATKYHQYLLHSYWQIKELGKAGFPEPPKGDASKRAEWEQHQTECYRDAVSLSGKKVSPERRKLNNIFKDADARRRNKSTDDTFLHLAMGSRGVIE